MWTQTITQSNTAGRGPLACGVIDLATEANATLGVSRAALGHHPGTERCRLMRSAFRENMLHLVASRTLTFCGVEEV